ncbi:MAG TPA: MBL fold metallo-hydrolase [Phycisphaerae bacterium]|nr:hypothetical protein [Phycisphaerae bacterium]HOB72908.1 MBL fold metallo-hydrolase [Phycisphaerae bacterium]HOJ53043.1 MBL fold metallo-hydrolase [Phycisphaerae bacterium]HOL24780.1 MBL fold metallo-hydrolase [Phycisphaerae bacterium]HPP19316.1 MBL fold metallo-hydrolase [Phycisphaerae bacterium]
MSWRDYSDWAKTRPTMLRLAEWLGKGRGGTRLLDAINPPPPAPRRPELSGWERQELAALWIGHATVLLRIGGRTVLADPVFSNRVGIGLGLLTGGPQRLVKPALSLHELPRLDLVLVSHAHFDHLDRPTLSRLPKRVPVVTSEHNSDLIRDLGFHSVTEVRWGQRVLVGGLCVTGWPVRHWGARTFIDHHRGYAAFLLEAEGRRILYGGDTAWGLHFKDVGRVDLAVLGIGAYDPYIAAHATPEQAWAMADHVRADFMLPMHHSTFRLSHEPIHEPLERLLAAAGRSEDRIICREIGQLWTPDAVATGDRHAGRVPGPDATVEMRQVC